MYVVESVRFDTAKIVIGFSNGYFVVISTNKDDIGQVSLVNFAAITFKTIYIFYFCKEF